MAVTKEDCEAWGQVRKEPSIVWGRRRITAVEDRDVGSGRWR